MKITNEQALLSAADLGFAKGKEGWTMASAMSASLNGDGGPPVGPGAQPLVGD